MIRIVEVDNSEQVFLYQMRFSSPYFYPVDCNAWKTSFAEDMDGEGRTLFKALCVKAAYEEEELIGFIQYGKTAFGFDPRGELSADNSYCVIRNFYFNRGREDAGFLLLKQALDTYASADTVYAFFHYFGMSCFARHGKLYERHAHIEALLKKNGFETEHENVYYSCILSRGGESEVDIVAHNVTKGNQQYMDFLLSGDQVGGCEIHYVDGKTAYLRWIYINENLTGRGIGSKCMNALKNHLYQRGVARFDTDTALLNLAAQHFYEKNGFTREGITRSFYRTN